MLADVLASLRYDARMLVREFRLLVDCHYVCGGPGREYCRFNVVNAVLLKPPPVAQPDELASLYTSDFSGPG